MKKNKDKNKVIKLEPRNLLLPAGIIRPFGHRSIRRKYLSIDESGPGIIRLDSNSGVLARVYSKLYGEVLMDDAAIELRNNLQRNASIFDPDGFLEWGEEEYEVRLPEQPVPRFRYRVIIDYSKGFKASDLKIVAEFPGDPSERVLSVRDYLRENNAQVTREGGSDRSHWVF